MLTIKKKIVYKEYLGSHIEIRNDAGIGLTSTQQIILAGGSEESGLLTSQVVLLDPRSTKYEHIQDLPVPAKKGFVQEYENCLYYIGGLIKNPDEESSQSFIPSPLMRYHFNSSQWEILDTTQETNPKGEESVSFKELYQPGNFIFKGKIYLVGGQRIDIEAGEFSPNRKIYSIDIHFQPYSLHDEEIELKMCSNHPICVLNQYENTVQVFGGKTQDMKLFRNNFEINLSTKSTNEMKPFPFFVKEHYPPIYQKEYIIIISFPKIAVQRYGDQDWKVFDFKREESSENYRSTQVVPNGEENNGNPVARNIGPNLDLDEERRSEKESLESRKDEKNSETAEKQTIDTQNKSQVS